MVSPRGATSLLLSSVLLASWTASSVWSDDLNKPDLSGTYMSDKNLPFETRPQVTEVLNFADKSMTVIKDLVNRKNEKRVSVVLKQLSKWASAAPFIGPLFSLVNMALVFLPQHDPVFELVEKGFAEVNRKLDSLSIQISNLATDVEWFNYVSVYSQDETRILNAWRRYREVSNMQWLNSTAYLAKLFTNFYEYALLDASVDNIYHYLTVNGTSLSKNLNDLLKKKFKCDIVKIVEYNQHFSQLLWKGKALTNIYWKLMGFDMSKNDYAHFFRDVHRVQAGTVDFCLNNSMQYVRDDVVEIAKLFRPEKKQDIADAVKRLLDNKYSWYRWVVLVYDKADEGGQITPLNVTKIPINSTIIVAVNYIPEEDMEKETKVNEGESENNKYNELAVSVDHCLRASDPVQCLNTESEFKYTHHGTEIQLFFHHHFIVTFSSNTENVARAPKSKLFEYTFSKGQYVSLHFLSVKDSICDQKCEEHGHCKRLLNSTEGLCVCEEGYYGDDCQEELKEMNSTVTSSFVVKTTDVKLLNIESKLDEIISRIKG